MRKLIATAAILVASTFQASAQAKTAETVKSCLIRVGFAETDLRELRKGSKEITGFAGKKGTVETWFVDFRPGLWATVPADKQAEAKRCLD